MELCKTHFSPMLGKLVLDKFFVNSNDKSYSQLYDFLCDYHNEKTYNQQSYSVILKFSSSEITEYEYNIGEELKEFPNFMKFLRKIKCNDDILNIEKNNKENLTFYKINNLGIKYDNLLVMNYYDLKSVDSFSWNNTNFNNLLNIIKQVIFATINAYFKIGFSHNNLHCANVLLKPKTTDKIYYQTKELYLEDYEAIIMDYDKSKLRQNNIKDLFFKSIGNFLSSLDISLFEKNINFYYDDNKILEILNIDKNINYFDEIEKIIDTFKFRI